MSQKQLHRLLEDEIIFNDVSEELFKSCNLDSNGYIDYREFSVLIKRISFDLGVNTVSKDDTLQIFSKLDINNNGKIKKDQMKIFFRDLITSLVELDKYEIRNQKVDFSKEK
jgi:hypothetical protein